MILTNIESVPGMRIKAQYGLVSGSTVRAKNVIKDIGAGLKNMVGGELKSYTELLIDARKEAVARMTEQAERMGANAIINVRFATSAITAGAAEVYAYGTAVVVEQIAG
ncbi:YbjQ family protein [bacterium]|nr:YbjQ family protein [bacterium]